MVAGMLSSDRTEQAARVEAIKKLQVRHDQIEARIETMYIDKLDGRITQEFFDKQAATLRLKRDSLSHKIQSIQKVALASVDQAIDMLRLTSRASELFLQQPASEQRRLLQTVVEKAAWKGGALQTALFEPFEIPYRAPLDSSRSNNRSSRLAHGPCRDWGETGGTPTDKDREVRVRMGKWALSSELAGHRSVWRVL